MDKKESRKSIATNKKAFHDYFVDDKFEAGIELFGTEVKSIRAGQVNLKDSWCDIKNGEIFVQGMHISPYEKGNIFNRDPLREGLCAFPERKFHAYASEGGEHEADHG